MQSSRARWVWWAPSQPLPRRSPSRRRGEVLLPGKMEAAAGARGRFLRPLGAALMHAHPPRGAARCAGPRGRGQRLLPPPPPPRGGGAGPRPLLGLGPAGNGRRSRQLRAVPWRRRESPASALQHRLRYGGERRRGWRLPSFSSMSVPAEPPRRWHAPPSSFPQPAKGGGELGRARRRRAPIQRPPTPARCCRRGTGTGTGTRTSPPHRAATRSPAARLAGAPGGSRSEGPGRGAAGPGGADAVNSAPPPQGGSACGSRTPGPRRPPAPAPGLAGRPGARQPRRLARLLARWPRVEWPSRWEPRGGAGQRPAVWWPQPQRDPPPPTPGGAPLDPGTPPGRLLPELTLIVRKLTLKIFFYLAKAWVTARICFLSLKTILGWFRWALRRTFGGCDATAL